jgi:hypothetical protein
MRNGRWSPIRDGIVDKIKSDRPASIGDFALIVTQLHKRKTHISVSILAERLCWSREKVSIWLEKFGLEIEYFGKTMGPSKGILRAIPKENLDSDNKDIWFVLFPAKKGK